MTTAVRVLGNRVLAAGILALCVAGMTQQASATGTPNVLVSVTAVPSPVTLSQPGSPNFGSYRITVRNNSGSTLNHVRFRGNTDVAGSDAALFINPNVSETGVVLDPNPVVVSTGTVRCTIEGDSIDCTLGNYGHLAHGGVASFNAVVRAPVVGASIVFSWNLGYAIGYSHRSITGSTVTPLQAAGGDSVSAYIPRAGATLSTGAQAVPAADDPSTTRLTVLPQNAVAIIASIVEDDNGGNSCSPHNKCFGHTVTVLKAQTQTKASVGDGLRDPLLIVLRRDASTFRKNAPIEHVDIFYQVVPAIGGGGTRLRSCQDNGIYTPPGPNQPCIRERREYPRQRGHDQDGGDHDPGEHRRRKSSLSLSGDREIVIEAIDNGRFIW